MLTRVLDLLMQPFFHLPFMPPPSLQNISTWKKECVFSIMSLDSLSLPLPPWSLHILEQSDALRQLYLISE